MLKRNLWGRNCCCLILSLRNLGLRGVKYLDQGLTIGMWRSCVWMYICQKTPNPMLLVIYLIARLQMCRVTVGWLGEHLETPFFWRWEDGKPSPKMRDWVTNRYGTKTQLLAQCFFHCCFLPTCWCYSITVEAWGFDCSETWVRLMIRRKNVLRTDICCKYVWRVSFCLGIGWGCGCISWAEPLKIQLLSM